MAAVHRQIVRGEIRGRERIGGASVLDVSYPPGTRFEPHAHAASNITLVLRGSVDEIISEERHTARACTVIVKPAGTVHANAVGGRGARTVVVELPPSVELRSMRVVEGPTGLSAGILAVRRAATGGSVREAGAALERLVAGALEDELSDFGAGDEADWVARVREMLDASIESPPSLEEVARAVGKHPVSVCRGFARRYGVTVRGYVRRARVALAADRIAGSDEPLARVAVSFGFSDQSHLTRAFGRELGVTPGGYRALVGA